MNTQEKQIELEAADWLVRLDDVDRAADAQEQAEWIAWLQRSPRHVQAYFDIANVSQSVDEVPQEGRQRIREMLREYSAAQAPIETQSAKRHWLVAAAVAVCSIAAVLWFAVDRPNYRTGVGEQISYRLPDGSSMVLNTRSQAQVAMNERERIVKLDGEGLFTVARDAQRPFLVQTRNAVTRAIGTQFNVYSQADGSTRVSCIEGVVQVAPTSPQNAAKPAAIMLLAGQQVVVRDAVIKKESAPKISAATAWRKKTLVFEDAPLQEVAAQFNRYNVVQFSIAPEVGDERRLSGTFDPLHPEYFRAYLEKDATLKIELRDEVVNVAERQSVSAASAIRE